jgi:DegV family protein with EDD domain
LKIAIVTDSTSDISPQEAKEYNISVVPAILIVDGKEYEDGTGMSRKTFYSKLPSLNPPPTTATPSIGMFSQVYQHLLNQNYDHIISIHAAASLSALCDTAKTAAHNFDNMISVVDSGQLSMGLGFQVLAAARAAAKYKIDKNLQPIFDVIDSIQQRVRLMAMLDTMEQLRRSGRVSWMQASLGAIMKLKLFIELRDGAVTRLGEARTRKKALQRFAEMLKKLGPLEQLTILHTDAYEDALALAEKFPLPSSELPTIRDVTTIIGNHVGVKGVGFAAVMVN